MAQRGETVPENSIRHVIIMPHSTISIRHGSSSTAHLDPTSSSKMDFTGPPSTSPSRPRAFSTDPPQQSNLLRHGRIASAGSPSRESSQDKYVLHSNFEDLGTGQTQRSENDVNEAQSYEYEIGLSSSVELDAQEGETSYTTQPWSSSLVTLLSDIPSTLRHVSIILT